jgi:xanthine dehydrogenase iron-sulfur cluster and FAD-binding subunit A
MTNTHILFHDFTYLEPGSLSETMALLQRYGSQAQVLAGGTYLLVQIKMERQAPAYIINVRNIRELDGIVWQDGALRLGARTAIRALCDSARVWADYTALAEACAAFGSTQIQKMGTIGGNLCNGSPASDAVPALMAFDARLVLLSSEGEREISVSDFLLGPGRTALRRDELLATIRLPPMVPGTGSAFLKISRVAADLAKMSAAAVLVRDGDRIVDCRLALGSVAPTVLRAKRAEASLIGQSLSPELALEAGELASQEVSPIDDVRSTTWYRREVTKAAVHDVLCRAWERAGGAQPFDTLGGASRAWRAGRIEQAYQDGTHAKRRELGASVQPDEVDDRDPDPGTIQVGPGQSRPVELTVNGERHRLWVAPNELLINVLRERLELTGTKYGCGIGECGACTIHLNGEPALACLTLAIAVDGSQVSTVEGLLVEGELDPLQDAFIEHQAFQCGYCTPGMLMMAKRLLQERPAPTEDDVRDYLRGNRCRCTGFASIVRAVLSQVGTAVGDGKEA